MGPKVVNQRPEKFGTVLFSAPANQPGSLKDDIAVNVVISSNVAAYGATPFRIQLR
jgi:hypothetical protein